MSKSPQRKSPVSDRASFEAPLRGRIQNRRDGDAAGNVADLAICYVLAMALFSPEFSRCALCERQFEPSERPFATSDGFLDGFESYSDAVFHWECVARWSERKAFARAIFESERESLSSNEYWAIVFDDDAILVCANPDLGEPRANVVLAETGSIFEVPLDGWTRWVRGESGPEVQHSSEIEPLTRARGRLLTVLPTSEAVLAAARGAKP